LQFIPCCLEVSGTIADLCNVFGGEISNFSVLLVSLEPAFIVLFWTFVCLYLESSTLKPESWEEIAALGKDKSI